MKKIFISLICSVIAIILFGSLKLLVIQQHAKIDGLDYERFWLKKTFSSPKFDVVLIGDSRVKNGLSPLHMEKELPGLKILNFGYNGMILDAEMLSAAETKLAPKSKRPIIIVGISPGAFVPNKDSNGLYHEYKNKGVSEFYIVHYFGAATSWLFDITKAISIDDFRKREGLEGKLTKEYLDSGWMSVAAEDLMEEDVTAIVKEEIKNKKNDVFLDEKIMKDTIEKMISWSNRGIQVYAIRMPQHPLFKAFEDKLYKFDESDFRSRIDKSGVIWLHPSESSYFTYDGVHLEKESAEKLSVEVARMVRELPLKGRTARAQVEKELGSVH